MSYRSRKKNRDCANIILKLLFEKAPESDMFLVKKDWYQEISVLSLSEIKAKVSIFSDLELTRAIRVLHENEYITMQDVGNPLRDTEPKISLTLKGRDAYLNDYYELENRRDRLDSIELNTRWIIPLLSIFISFFALVVTVFNACNQKKICQKQVSVSKNKAMKVVLTSDNRNHLLPINFPLSSTTTEDFLAPMRAINSSILNTSSISTLDKLGTLMGRISISKEYSPSVK